jgi:hypothetical protein
MTLPLPITSGSSPVSNHKWYARNPELEAKHAELESAADALLRADRRQQRARAVSPPVRKRAPQVQTGPQPLRLSDLKSALARKRRQTMNGE